jgi:hypothetical protein
MPIPSSVLKRVRSAIGDAFSSYDELRLVVGEGAWANLTNVQLEKIAKPDSQGVVAFNLVRWANRRGRVRELVEICLAENPDHPDLQAAHAEVCALPLEVPLSDDGVTIDEESYPSAPPPLTAADKRRARLNFIVAAILLVGIFFWTVRVFDNAWIFWSGTIGSAISTKIAEVILDRPLFLQLVSIVRRPMTHRATGPVLLSSIVAFIPASLFVAHVQYLGPGTALAMRVEGAEINPGGEYWMLAPPWGRRVSLSFPAIDSDTETVYPWSKNKFWAPPRIVIKPNFDLADISVTETEKTLQWQLTISLTRQDKKQIVNVDPYRAGPVIIPGAIAMIDHTPYPPSFKIQRPDQTLYLKDLLVIPGDMLSIQIHGPMADYSRQYRVLAPQSPETGTQLVLVPSQ